MVRDWIEFNDASEEAIALDLAHISAVRKEGRGSIVVCGGQAYSFVNVPYLLMLEKLQFLRNIK